MIITLPYLELIYNTTNTFYCVARGLKTGIYGSYSEVQEQINGIPNSHHFKAERGNTAAKELWMELAERDFTEELSPDEMETMNSCHELSYTETGCPREITLSSKSEPVLVSLPTNDCAANEPIPLGEILRMLPRTFESKVFKEAMEKRGYSTRSAYRALKQLRAQKLITRAKPGSYYK